MTTKSIRVGPYPVRVAAHNSNLFGPQFVESCNLTFSAPSVGIRRRMLRQAISLSWRSASFAAMVAETGAVLGRGLCYAASCCCVLPAMLPREPRVRVCWWRKPPRDARAGVRVYGRVVESGLLAFCLLLPLKI